MDVPSAAVGAAPRSFAFVAITRSATGRTGNGIAAIINLPVNAAMGSAVYVLAILQAAAIGAFTGIIAPITITAGNRIIIAVIIIIAKIVIVAEIIIVAIEGIRSRIKPGRLIEFSFIIKTGKEGCCEKNCRKETCCEKDSRKETDV